MIFISVAAKIQTMKKGEGELTWLTERGNYLTDTIRYVKFRNNGRSSPKCR